MSGMWKGAVSLSCAKFGVFFCFRSIIFNFLGSTYDHKKKTKSGVLNLLESILACQEHLCNSLIPFSEFLLFTDVGK